MRAHSFLYDAVDPSESDLINVARWLNESPENITVHIQQESIEKFQAQGHDPSRVTKIMSLLQQGATVLPVYVADGRVLEGRNRLAAFWQLGMKTIPVAYASSVVTEGSYQPPTLHTGDKILKGKFKNSPAEIKGFKKDKHNQPVLKTNKGDIQLFKPRVTKLMKESYINDDIDDVLLDRGYKLLGKGQDQRAWLEPGTGQVLKIFGTKKGSDSSQYTKAQITFKLFADYCKAHPNNEFLPQFSGWETFQYNGLMYLQIRCERLFEFAEPSLKKFLERIASNAEYNPAQWGKQWLEKELDQEQEFEDSSSASELVTLIGEDGFWVLWDTIRDLANIAMANDIVLDLHAGNFMLGSDGHIVISDPFFSGWGHQ